VLKNGGRVSVSDIILLKQLPGELAESLQVHTHCVAGAVLESEYLRMATEAGLKEALVEKHPAAIDAVVEADPLGRELSAFLPSGESLSDYIASANFTAVKA
jgi:arsenite methyltransferase